MKHKTYWSILVVLLAAGFLLRACGGDQGVHSDGGVHGPDGVFGDAQPGPNPAVGSPSADVVVIENSGNLVTWEYDYAGFRELEIGSLDVEIHQGDTFRVVVKVEENLFDYVRVTQQGKTLKIGLDSAEAYHMVNIIKRAEVTMPILTKLEVAGSGDVTMQNFESAEAMDIVVKNTGSLLAENGSAGDLSIVASGTSSADLAGMAVGNADVEADGASTVIVFPGGQLDVRARGAASVFYLGNPTLGKIDTDISSSVEQK